MTKGKSGSKWERKAERRKNRSLETKKARQEREKKEKNAKIIKYGGLAVILIVAGFYLSNSKSDQLTPPSIIINPLEYDFGDVSVAGGIVKTGMNIKNEGGSDLLINDMETSCGCTSATVTKDGEEGPAFNMRMHGTNPVGWSETLKPGEIALLTVYYDPNVHPDMRGPVTRSVVLYSNDQSAPKKEVRIFVNQVA
jgi:hypothetical protein